MLHKYNIILITCFFVFNFILLLRLVADVEATLVKAWSSGKLRVGIASSFNFRVLGVYPKKIILSDYLIKNNWK